MAIQVTCPGCMSRFSVSEKYAGKKGPCPKCKKEILIPAATEQVVIHAPEMAGPKDSAGVSVLKPIRREEFKVATWMWVVWGIGFVAVLGVAIAMRVGQIPTSPAILALGALLLAPPIVAAGYSFLRDDTLAGYSGREFWTRTVICSAVFAATWLIYVGLARYFEHPTLATVSVIEMAIYVALMVGLGFAASLLAFEWEVFQAVMHYLVYFAITLMLCLIIGIELAEPLSTAPEDPRAAARRAIGQ